ncbi:SMP-30/gluconolactonase/LRE family protein [Chryseosolibacter indicus]|uniref:SMP-30/gluconolactonase/LRE family protein n=1 Tax=Chryseosolibacter indicus TaxID=2782351 RepID=A0ABS5VWE5_9BACT|nr:SMP-30/gluconolactonase/LRE family protein [Chryseosolibacter indicus]MBT1705651.1 SMP-30/gluconolactonase/LRE family protein [Chryseosolibacter indicus]
MKKLLTFVIIVTSTISCKVTSEVKTTGSIERLDPSLDALVSPDAKIEILAEGYEWSEGPVWVESQNMLLFSDVPKNTIYKWTEKEGAQVYLTPSGYTGSEPSQRKEPGSNGLTLDPSGRLVLCQHGDRRVARMDASLDAPKPIFVTLADNFEGKKLSSPNDVVFKKNGEIFFTDPPYGLPTQGDNDPAKETPFNGVYRVTTGGEVKLLVDSLTRPNGIAFTPDEKTFIVANSDPEKATWYAFDLEGDSVVNQRIFFDATPASKAGEQGLPDGFRIDKEGNMFATGPGGMWIFNREGKVIGKIKLPQPTSNCAFSADEKTLYITSDMYLLRIKLRK